MGLQCRRMRQLYGKQLPVFFLFFFCNFFWSCFRTRDSNATVLTLLCLHICYSNPKADAGGLATPTAIVRNGTVFVYFAYEGLPAGAGLRGIGAATATHPLGPFTRTPPVAAAPAGWHRPSGRAQTACSKLATQHVLSLSLFLSLSFWNLSSGISLSLAHPLYL